MPGSGSPYGGTCPGTSTSIASSRGTIRSAMERTRLQKYRGADIGKTKRKGGTKLMVFADGRGIPREVRIAPPSPAEVTIIESTREQVAVPRPDPGQPRTKPTRLAYDKAVDSDTLRLRFRERGIE